MIVADDFELAFNDGPNPVPVMAVFTNPREAGPVGPVLCSMAEVTRPLYKSLFIDQLEFLPNRFKTREEAFTVLTRRSCMVAHHGFVLGSRNFGVTYRTSIGAVHAG